MAHGLLDARPAAEPKLKCEEPDCITLLSRWNPGPLCFVHSAMSAATRRDRREKREAQAA